MTWSKKLKEVGKIRREGRLPDYICIEKDESQKMRRFVCRVIKEVGRGNRDPTDVRERRHFERPAAGNILLPPSLSEPFWAGAERSTE